MLYLLEDHLASNFILYYQINRATINMWNTHKKWSSSIRYQDQFSATRHKFVPKLWPSRKPFKIFLKKLIHLPSYTPNYIIAIETMQVPIFQCMYRMNVKYLIRELGLNYNRFTKTVAHKNIQKKYWYKHLQRSHYNLSYYQIINENQHQYQGH